MNHFVPYHRVFLISDREKRIRYQNNEIRRQIPDIFNPKSPISEP